MTRIWFHYDIIMVSQSYFSFYRSLPQTLFYVPIERLYMVSSYYYLSYIIINIV